jgi:carbamoyltransferase
MLMVYQVKQDKRPVIPAVTSTVPDGARRVAPEYQPRYHQLISDFERLTGVPVVLNTSFNEAADCLYSRGFELLQRTRMDVLFLRNYMLRR